MNVCVCVCVREFVCGKGGSEINVNVTNNSCTATFPTSSVCA